MAEVTATGEGRVKSPAQLALIEQSARIADEALTNVLSHGLVGLSEIEIAMRLDSEMERLGSHGVSFPTIVATGAGAAEPHHEPGNVTVKTGDMVVIDMGASVDGWRSDMTRTVRTGDADPRLVEMFSLVRAAQEAGLSSVRPGVTGAAVDEAVRAVFRDAGVEDLFIHGTGHGVGLVIHEFPILNRTCETELLEGEVVTVEPGLYREGVGGVRIEDLVVVTATGYRTLTHTPKELSCLRSARTT